MQVGSGKCSLCSSEGVTKISCPLNDAAKKPDFKKHYNSLITAVRKEQIDMVKKLIDSNKSNIGYQNEFGWTALMYASKQENNEIVKILLDTGKSGPELQEKYGWTALMYAVELGNVDVVKSLIESNQSHPEYGNLAGYTAFDLAVKSGNIEIVKMLLNTRTRDYVIKESFINASYTNNLDIINLFLDTGKVNPGEMIDIDDEMHTSAMIIACSSKNVDIVKRFMEFGNVHLEAQDSSGYTALMSACRYRTETEIVKLLINTPNKAYPELQDENGNTALMHACNSDQLEVVKLLLGTNRAHPEYTNNKGENALIYMSKTNSPRIVKVLLESGINPAVQDKSGWTALIRYTLSGYLDIVKLLLETGEAHPELQTREGDTALMIASGYGHADIVRVLLETGDAHPEFKDEKGRTALMEASRSGHVEIVKILLDTGKSQPLLRDNRGNTASDMAMTPEIKNLINSYLTSRSKKARTGILSHTEHQRKNLEILDPLKLCKLPSSPENKESLEVWYKLYRPNPKDNLSFREMCAALARLHKVYGHRNWATIALCQRPLSEWSPERFIRLVSFAHHLGIKRHPIVEKYPGGPKQLEQERGTKYLENAMPVVLKYYCTGLRRKLQKNIK